MEQKKYMEIFPVKKSQTKPNKDLYLLVVGTTQTL